MTLSPAGYLSPAVVPVGSGPEQRQQAALRGYGFPGHALVGAVADAYNDPAAPFDPATGTWPSPQAGLVNFPPVAAANYLALQYVAPGSASIPSAPGRPVPYTPPPVATVDGSAPSVSRPPDNNSANA